jgi:hypothetical protein
MKFLSIDQLDALTSFLSDREAGDRILNGRIEAFSWCAFVIEGDVAMSRARCIYIFPGDK